MVSGCGEGRCTGGDGQCGQGVGREVAYHVGNEGCMMIARAGVYLLYYYKLVAERTSDDVRRGVGDYSARWNFSPLSR